MHNKQTNVVVFFFFHVSIMNSLEFLLIPLWSSLPVSFQCLWSVALSRQLKLCLTGACFSCSWMLSKNMLSHIPQFSLDLKFFCIRLGSGEQLCCKCRWSELYIKNKGKRTIARVEGTLLLLERLFLENEAQGS